MHPSLDPEFATALLKAADATSNKYNRGVVGFVTGSEKYPGAALLGINAAHELQVGMACYLGPEMVSNLVLTSRPETVLGLEKAQALVVGSGIADDESGEQRVNLKRAAHLGLPMVIDAGALAQLDFELLTAPAILTPHAGEAERLFAKLGHKRHRKDIEANPQATAQELAELTSQVVLLKGSITVLAISGLAPIESGPGSTHLATAGTGDILAGMIGALAAKFVAQNGKINPFQLRDVGLLANQLLSEAAEIAAENGGYGASEVAKAISDAVGN